MIPGFHQKRKPLLPNATTSNRSHPLPTAPNRGNNFFWPLPLWLWNRFRIRICNAFVTGTTLISTNVYKGCNDVTAPGPQIHPLSLLLVLVLVLDSDPAPNLTRRRPTA